MAEGALQVGEDRGRRASADIGLLISTLHGPPKVSTAACSTIPPTATPALALLPIAAAIPIAAAAIILADYQPSGRDDDGAAIGAAMAVRPAVAAGATAFACLCRRDTDDGHTGRERRC
jgi:hypothetical protein